MSTLYDIRAASATTRDYDRTNREMGFPEDVPEGLLFHVAMMTGEGGRVVELWESREDQQAFVEDRLAEALEESGIGEPEFESFEVHNVVLGEGPIESGIVFDVTTRDVEPEAYDAIVAETLDEDDLPRGLRFHAAFFADGDLRIVDVWDSVQTNEDYVENTLTPVLEAQGQDPEAMEIEQTKLHRAYVT